MVEYSLEVVKHNGNTFRNGYKTLVSARKGAMKHIKQFGINTTFVNIIKVTKGWERPIVERIDFDEYVNSWTCIQYGKQGNSPMSKSRKYRLSPQTGRTLDWDKYWRYL